MRLKRIKTVKRGKRTYHYYKGKDALVRLPDPAKDPDGFMRAYARCERRKVEQTKRQEAGSLRSMITLWKQSPDFTKKAVSTRSLYAHMIEQVASLMEGASLQTIEQRDVRLMMDKLATTAGKANMMKRTLSSLYRWAIKRGYATTNPCAEIEEFEQGEHEAWPDHILRAALESDDDKFRLAVKVYLYTGQRSGDCCRMGPQSIEGDLIRVRQQKTGKVLLIPLHPDLEKEMAKHPIRGLTLLANGHGRPLTKQTMAAWCDRFGKKFGVKLVPHGLRKNAVNELLRAGCSVAETSAITGQTYQLVEYYARQINQEAMARQAMGKWNEHRTRTGKLPKIGENVAIFPSKNKA